MLAIPTRGVKMSGLLRTNRSEASAIESAYPSSSIKRKACARSRSSVYVRLVARGGGGGGAWRLGGRARAGARGAACQHTDREDTDALLRGGMHYALVVLEREARRDVYRTGGVQQVVDRLHGEGVCSRYS